MAAAVAMGKSKSKSKGTSCLPHCSCSRSCLYSLLLHSVFLSIFSTLPIFSHLPAKTIKGDPSPLLWHTANHSSPLLSSSLSSAGGSAATHMALAFYQSHPAAVSANGTSNFCAPQLQRHITLLEAVRDSCNVPTLSVVSRFQL